MAGEVTARTLVCRLLLDFGVISLDPTTPAGQAFPIEATDVDEILNEVTAAFQEIYEAAPHEQRSQNLSAYLNPPTTVTVTVTKGSTTISAFTGWQAWMLGCTIRINGDSQDNELTSQTQLARVFMGTSGATTATVFGDCVALDSTVGEIPGPVSIPQRTPMRAAFTLIEFMKAANYPLIQGPDGGWWGVAWSTVKVISYPSVFFVEGAANNGLAYVPRRIRLAPMPDKEYPLSYTALINAPRYKFADIDSGDHTTDPNVMLPIVDTKVESILMPVCRKRLLGRPKFRARDCAAEINEAYLLAVGTLKNAMASTTPRRVHYV